MLKLKGFQTPQLFQGHQAMMSSGMHEKGAKEL